MTGFSVTAFTESNGGHDTGEMQFTGVARILGPRWTQLPILTIGLCGVQILWSVEFSYGECQ